MHAIYPCCKARAARCDCLGGVNFTRSSSLFNKLLGLWTSIPFAQRPLLTLPTMMEKQKKEIIELVNCFAFSIHKAFYSTTMQREVPCSAQRNGSFVFNDCIKKPSSTHEHCVLGSGSGITQFSKEQSSSNGAQIIRMINVVLCHPLQSFTPQEQ